jgi:hypothetical protein
MGQSSVPDCASPLTFLTMPSSVVPLDTQMKKKFLKAVDICDYDYQSNKLSPVLPLRSSHSEERLLLDGSASILL